MNNKTLSEGSTWALLETGHPRHVAKNESDVLNRYDMINLCLLLYYLLLKLRQSFISCS